MSCSWPVDENSPKLCRLSARSAVLRDDSRAVFPPPPMARLQPMPASHELLAPFDVAITALRPNWAKPDPDMREELRRLGWKVLENTGSSSQEGLWQKLEASMAERGGVVDPQQSEISRGIFDELPPWKILMLVEDQMREDDSALLQTTGRRRSADQYEDSMKMQLMFGVMVRAMQYIKLADTSRLPVERMTLQELLRKWGAFRHVGSGACAGCAGADGGGSQDNGALQLQVPGESQIMTVRNVQLDIEKIQVGFLPFLAVRWRGECLFQEDSSCGNGHHAHEHSRSAVPC